MNEPGTKNLFLSVAEAAERVAEGAALIDVRTDEEWDVSRIPGATHIRLGELAAQVADLDRDAELVIYCRTDNRSQMAAEALAGAGYNASYVVGGITAWAEQGKELDPPGGEVA